MRNLIKCGLLLGCTVSLWACSGKSQTIQKLDQKDIVKSVDRLKPETDGDGFKDDLALTILDLDVPGDYVWESKSGGQGDYEFRGFGFGDEKGGIDRLVLNGVHMRGDAGPFVDSIILEGLNYTSADGQWTESLAKGKIVFNDRPAVLDEGFENVLSSVLLDGRGLMTMPGAYFDNLTIRPSEDFEINADFLGWTAGDSKEKISFALEDMDLVNFEAARITLSDEVDNEKPRTPHLKFSAKHLSAKNMEVAALSTRNPFSLNMNTINPFERAYDSLVADDMSLIFDGMNMDIPSLQSGITGNVESTYSRLTSAPSLTLEFDREPNDPELYSIWNIFDGLGQEKWALNYKSKIDLDVRQDRASVDYMDLVIEDGGQVSVDYQIGGYYHHQKIMNDVRAKMTESRQSGAAPDMESIQTEMKNAFSKLSLSRLEIVLDDNSLLEKILGHMAADQDISLDVARQQAKAYAMLMTLGVSDPYMSALADDFAESAQSFVVKGGGMKFSINPEDGFMLGEAIIESQSGEEVSTKTLYSPLNADFEHIPD